MHDKQIASLSDLHVTVTRLLTTPLKGTAIHERKSLNIGPGGPDHDRLFYLIDDRSRLVNGRQYGPLSTIVAQYDTVLCTLTLTFPTGETVSQRIPDCGDPVTTDFMSHDAEGYVVTGTLSESISEFTGRHLRLVKVTKAGSGADRHPLSIIGSSSIDFVRHLSPRDVEVDYRRFRMLIEIDGAAPHQEDLWTGKELVGPHARIQVLEQIPRCSVIRQDPSTGKRDFDALRTLISYRKAQDADSPYGPPITQDSALHQVMFGVYGRAQASGVLAVGDELVVRDADCRPRADQ